MNFLQGLGAVGAGLMSANKILRDQKNDEITNQYRAAMGGLTNIKLTEAKKALENEAAYGQIADQNQGGTQTILRADAPADEWGQQQADTIQKPADRRSGFEAMAQEALKRGDQAGYAKFIQFGDHLKKQQDEGVADIAKMIHSGTVDTSAAERAFNNAGTMRVLPGTVKWDADTGTMSGIDARTGQPLSMDKTAAQRFLVMSGAIKPDEYASAGDGQVFNKRTGEVKGTARGKPIVANGTVLIPGEDENGDPTMKPIYTAPKQPSVVVHTGRDELTPPQKRANEEIDAARKALAGMSRDEVLRKTQAATATGRTNREYDPQIAGQWKLANRRKHGDDAQFDQFTEQRFQPQQPAQKARQPVTGDAHERFSADPSMKGMRTGKMTPQGVEVLDSNGRLVGHYN